MTSKIKTVEHLLVKPGLHVFFVSEQSSDNVYEGYVMGMTTGYLGGPKLALFWREYESGDDFINGYAPFANFDWYLWERRPNA